MFDIALIGAGIMSVTMAAMLKEIDPSLRIVILESLSDVGLESSEAWNNAGTGHAGLCELNYTPMIDGVVDIEKALKVTNQFEISKQYWSHLVNKHSYNPSWFINSVPHMSIVKENRIEFLRKRQETMSAHHFYEKMEYIENASYLKRLAPITMEGRYNKVGCTFVEGGTDVNFGEITRVMARTLKTYDVSIHYNCKITDIERNENKDWKISFESHSEKRRFFLAKKIFIGAGGASVLLLEKTGIPEARNYGGFPIRGQWLVCNNRYIIERHNVKMYGEAALNAPPMSVEHLDTRIINGKKQLLYGPAAGFTTKFLKIGGSSLDLFKSIKYYNLKHMLIAGWHNIPLTRYLIKQIFMSFDDKMDQLRDFYPNAEELDWELKMAGQRVQVIKKDKKYGGVLQFGTETVLSEDKSVSAVLGASPGASTVVHIIFSLIKDIYPEFFKDEGCIKKVKEMIPSYGIDLVKDKTAYEHIHKYTAKTLNIKE